MNHLKSLFKANKLRICSIKVNAIRRCASAEESTDSRVVGLSSNVIKDSSDVVGPGANKEGDYKNEEYFRYHKLSYFEAEIEMQKYRLPQPSSKSN